jgi:hypothetical protein
MRKIEQQLITAIRSGKPFRLSNTTYDGKGNIHLYGHHIIRNLTPNGCEYNWCGWYTRTTASRLDAVMGWLNSFRKFCDHKFRADRSADGWTQVGEVQDHA